MSYQVLARKWRPGNFAEMVGQEHVLQALINALDNNRLHHAYLFTGTRGVGKTTIARILAKALNCEQGVTSTPCGECGSCREISEGRFVDLIEVDAASRTKVEDTRELLDNVQYAPTAGRYKVYLIDEVHMLSNHSFNALLKTLEEPPPHIKFLLATTDPQKLPVTILSRCLQFNLKNLSPERIVHYLQSVLEQEQVPYEENGLWALARAADGSMRDALSLTDQAIAHGNGQLKESEISAMLGTIDLSVVVDICDAVATADSNQMLSLVETMSEHSPDYNVALAEILSIWHRVAIAQAAPEALDNRHGDYNAVMLLASSLPREDVQLFYQIGLLGRRDLNLAPDPRTGFEMALLRMIAFKPTTNPDGDREKAPVAVAASLAPVMEEQNGKKSEQATAKVVGVPVPRENPSDISRSAATPPPTTVIETKTGVEKEAAQMPDSKPLESRPEIEDLAAYDKLAMDDVAIGHKAIEQEGLVEKQDQLAEKLPETPAATNSVAGVTSPNFNDGLADPASELVAEAVVYSEKPEVATERLKLEFLTPDNWVTFYQSLPLTGVIQNTAANLVLIEQQETHLRFQLDSEQSSLYEVSHQQRLAEALSQYLDQQVTVEINVGKVAAETPQANRIRLQQERLAEAVESMKQDPVVNNLIETFDAVLLEETIVPVEQAK